MSLETFGTGTPGAESSDSCSLRSLIALSCRARAEAFARKLQDKLWTLGQPPSEHDDSNQPLSSPATSDCQLHHHFAKDVHASYQTSWTVAQTVNGDSVVTTVPFTKSRSKEELYPVVCSCCTSTSMENDKLQDTIQNYAAASSTQYRLALAHALAADNRLRDSDQYFDFGIETPPESIEESEALLTEGKSLLVLNAEDGLPSQPESGCVFSSPVVSSDSDEDPAKEEEAEESGDTSFYDVDSLSQSPATPFLGTFEPILENQVVKTELQEELSEDPINGSLRDLMHSLEQLTPTVTPIPDDLASTTAEPTCCANSSASTLSNSPIPFRELPLDYEVLSGLRLPHESDADKEHIKSAGDQDTGRDDVLVSLVMYTSSVAVAESTEEFASPLVPFTGLHVLPSLSSFLGAEEDKDDEALEQLTSSRQTHLCDVNAEIEPRELQPRVDVITSTEVLARGDPKDEADVAQRQCTTLSSCADDVAGIDGVFAVECYVVSSSACDHAVESQGDRALEEAGQNAIPATAITKGKIEENEPEDVHCVMDKLTMAVGENNGERQPCFAAREEAEAGVLDCLIRTTNISAVNGESGVGQTKARSSESESSGYTTESIPPSSDSDVDSEDLACVLDKSATTKNNESRTNREQWYSHPNNYLEKLALSAEEFTQECDNLNASTRGAPTLGKADDDEIVVLSTESDSGSSLETGESASSSISGNIETAPVGNNDVGKPSVCKKTAEPTESETTEFDSHDEDEEDIPATRRRVQRSTSLKTGKTPPGTPGRKKIVRFADALGLDLAAIRTFMDEVPQVPKSAYRDLSGVDDEFVDPELKADSGSVAGRQAPLGRSLSAPVTTTFVRRPLPLTTTSFVPNRSLMAGFTQPGSLPTFLEMVKSNRVSLENAVMVEDMTIRGLVRVLNIDFHKSVIVRYTTDEWCTSSDIMGSYVTNSCDGLSDRFSFHIYIPTVQPGQRLIFAVCYRVAGQEFWDNNSSHNYVFQCISTCAPSAASTLLLPSPSDPWMPYL